MKSYILLILSGLLISTFALQAKHASDPSLIAQGAKLYSENCGRCHNPRPASEYSQKEWSVVMPHMREKAHMTGTEALAVEAFLSSTLTAERKVSVVSEDMPQRSGDTLIAQFGCMGCHQSNGSGSLGPALDGIIERKGKAFVLKKLSDPKFNNAASAMPRFPMTDADMREIIKYLGKL